jgi:organic radical activating enzyme
MNDSYMKNTSNKLDKISPAFCLAKYDLFSLYLHLGATHSCHLSDLKKLNVDEIKGPYDFFNFPEIKQVRKKMKDGIKDSDCNFCWNIEKNNSYSDRHLQSDLISHKYDEIVEMDPLKDDIIPSYLEVSFSNLCNMKCTYCNPNFSSRWENDIKQHGDYHNLIDIRSNEKVFNVIKKDNIFLKKFKEFFPQIIKNLTVLRITGGEPTIQDELYDILNYIENNPQPNLTLCINTNLCPPIKKFNKLINKLKTINDKVKQIFIYTSCDSSGEHAEFIREGLNYQTWKHNCHAILKEIKNSHLYVMCTFNNLCLTNEFKVFINDVYDMTQYSIGEKKSRIFFNIQPLSFPKYQSIEILDYDVFKDIINEIEELLNSYRLKYKNGIIVSKGFSLLNIEKFYNIKKIIKNNEIKNKIKIKKNFLYFLNQCKIRNRKDYLKIFTDKNYSIFFKEKKDILKIF